MAGHPGRGYDQSSSPRTPGAGSPVRCRQNPRKGGVDFGSVSPPGRPFQVALLPLCVVHILLSNGSSVGPAKARSRATRLSRSSHLDPPAGRVTGKRSQGPHGVSAALRLPLCTVVPARTGRLSESPCGRLPAVRHACTGKESVDSESAAPESAYTIVVEKTDGWLSHEGLR